MKKAQIINKILNKILIITALLYNIFSILAIKKRSPQASLFLTILQFYSAAIVAAALASLAANSLFLRLT